MLREMGEASVHSKVNGIAQQLDMVIQTVPWMTVTDLQRDEKFREVAVQTVGRTGYTFVFDSDTAVVRLHRDLRLENKNLPSVFRHLPELQNILETSLKGPGTAYGYYQLKAGDGNIMKRFIYIIPLHNATADHARLSVAATINVDDFLTPVKQAEANHNETKQFLIQASKGVIESFRHTGLLSMGVGILAVSLIAFFVMGIYLSRAVSRLREATARVNLGDFSTPVKPSGSGEVATLIDDFNRMVDTLSATTVSKQLLEASEAKLQQANGELRREIADRERTEEALAAEKERLNVTLRSIGDGVITADSEGRIVLINNGAERLTGWLQDQAAGQHLSQVFRVVTEAPGDQGNADDVSVAGQQAPEPGLSQKLLLARDGTARTIAETRSPILDKGEASWGPSSFSVILPWKSGWRKSFCKRASSNPWASWQAGSPTTSTTFSRSSSAISPLERCSSRKRKARCPTGSSRPRRPACGEKNLPINCSPSRGAANRCGAQWQRRS